MSDMAKTMHFQIHLTDDCNLKCLHCYHDGSSNNYLDSEQFDYILKEVLDYTRKCGSVPGRAIFCGGEPTLSPILFESIAKCREAGYNSVSVLTNGTLITDEFAQKLRQAGCTSVQICIEGNRETHNHIRNGTFDQVLVAWETCRRNGLVVKNQTTLQPLNYRQIREILDICRDRVDTVNFLRQVPPNKEAAVLTPSQWLEVLKELFILRLSCGRDCFDNYINVRDLHWHHLFEGLCYICNFKQDSFLSVIVEANGDVYPCRKANIKVGNIFRQSLEEIHAKNEVLQRARKKENLNDKCRECSRVERCGGCPGMANAVFGDYMAPDPQCFIEQITPEFWEEILRSDLPEHNLLRSGERPAAADNEVLEYMSLVGIMEEAGEEVAWLKRAGSKAAELGLAVSEEEIQRAADIFRQAMGLRNEANTVVWLKENRLSLEAWEAGLRQSVTLDKLENYFRNKII